jgi:hypothetical protein
MIKASTRSSGIARFSAAFGCVLLLHGCSAPAPEIAGMPDQIDYNWHVRPILSENCFKCHGPDPKSLKAGLRLDIGELAVGELPDTPGQFAIVAYDAGDSELIRRVTAENVDDRMPPQSEHKTLSALQIEVLRRWIDDGAQYQPHWAFIKPERPQVPDSMFADRAMNEIDAFVLHRLERDGLTPSAPADKETLINRVSLTLTGLPPALEEVDAFIADDSAAAYERLVDRLLASPRYAEHQTDYWMDIARWSESDGFLDDHHDRFLWPWRDWVIDAFQNNMPFDEFGTWQLAGDLLPQATREQILATAYLRVGKRTTENGAIDAEYKAEYMVERTDNALGLAFMGLTVGCARCHDHKYDPIEQRDYYSLGAFFNSNDEPGVYAPGFSGIQGGPTLPWADAETEARIDAAARSITEHESAYEAASSVATDRAGAAAASLLQASSAQASAVIRASLESGLAAHYAFDSARPASLQDLPRPRPPRIPPAAISEFQRNPFAPEAPENETAEQRRQREAAELLQRVPRTYNAEELTLSAAAAPGVPGAVIQSPTFRDGVQGQALFFDETNKGFLGRDVGWYDRTAPFSIDFWFFTAEAYENVPVINHLAEQNSGRTGYRLAIENGKLWVSLAHSPPANMIAVKSTDSLPVGAWTHVTFTYDGSSRAAGIRVYFNGVPAGVRVERDSLTRSMLPWSSGDVFDPFVGLAFGTRFREKAPVGSALDELRVFDRALTPLEVSFLHDENRALGGPGEELRAGLTELLAANDAAVRDALSKLTSAREMHNQLVTGVPQVLVMGDAPEPIPTFVLDRGVYSAPTEPVQPRGLESVFAWDDSLPQNRLGLARWLFDADNPLTARVFVNRLWQMHFGRGIVETSEDFGAQGAIPTHPELLDWLAVTFLESGWDVKALHRKIVLSSTYRQSSVLSDEALVRDPRNELYARGPRWRMTAEMVRDHALAVSGLLVEEVGGKSVKPYQPAGIWNPLNSFYEYPAPADVPDDEHHRRTLYTFVKRNALHPALRTFDFANRTESAARRRSSNTPLQALILMNDPQYVEAYRGLATVALRYSADETERLRGLYRLAVRVAPTDAHIDLLRRYYREQQAVFAANGEKTASFLEVGVTEADPTLDPVELAAMTNVAALVMNSPDAYTVR